MKKVCIIGCGAISGVHIDAIKSCKSAVLYGVCDIDESKRKIAILNNVKFYNNYEDVLKDSEIDAVHICTPHYLHFEMIKSALQYNKKVVCEKPAVITKNEFEELKKLDDTKNVCFVLQNRLNLSVEKLKDIIDNKEFGDVTGIKCILTWHRTKEYYKSGAWRGKWDTEGGGVLVNQAIHILDLMTYLAGDITSVKSNMMNYSLSDAIEVEDTFVSYMNIKNNVKGMFFATNANTQDEDFSVTVYFEKGKASYVFGKLFVNNEPVCEDNENTLGKSCWGSSHQRLISDFYDRNKYFNIDDIENTCKALFAMYESAKNGGKEITL